MDFLHKLTTLGMKSVQNYILNFVLLILISEFILIIQIFVILKTNK